MEEKVYVPPLKIQGIKTKLVPIIKQNICLDSDGIWIEPFMGSGVVGFNVKPNQAIFADTNPHIINFYNAIKDGKITSYSVRKFLEEEGKKLESGDAEFYYKIRERFNEFQDPLDFLFLNRSCFNGMMRFNREHRFNVPYGHKPQRFSKAYITKIVNQVKHIENLLYERDWLFICQSYEKTIEMAQGKNAFIYCDPPYIGRNVDYYDSWSEDEELRLKNVLTETQLPFMLSTWDYNQYRKNEYIDLIWDSCRKINKEHFYYIGAKEDNRSPMVEALLVNYPQEQVHNECEDEDLQYYLNFG